jgi:hypothetical protein
VLPEFVFHALVAAIGVAGFVVVILGATLGGAE